MESQLPNLYADGVAPVYRSKPEEVFFIRMQASPQPGSDDFGKVGGAFINCYVNADDLRSAEVRAVELIQQQDWQPERFEIWELVCVERVKDTPAQNGSDSVHELIQQAQADGEVSVFYCWPTNAPDAHDPDV